MLVRKTLKIYHHQCVYCGKQFDSESACSKTCSPAHRTAISRWRKKLPAMREQIVGGPDLPEGLLQRIGFYLDFPDARDEAIAALKAISDEVNNQLNLHNIRRVR